MRSRTVRLILAVASLAAFGVAAFFINRSEQSIAGRRTTGDAFDTMTREAATGLSELRMSQAAYVAGGQDVVFWVPKAEAAANAVMASLSRLKSTATTDDSRSAIDRATAQVVEFNRIDQRARDFLGQYMPVEAGDAILSDGGEAAAAFTAQIEIARSAEEKSAAAVEWSQRQREAIAIGSSAGIAILAILLLLPRQRTAPADADDEQSRAAAPVIEHGLGLRSTSESSPLSVSARAAHESLRAASTLCTDLGRVSDIEELQSLLGQASGLMDATGLMVWVGSTDGAELQPALAHGYTREMLARIPTLRRSADNAAAAAFRTGQLQIVLAQESSVSGAIVAPILASRGCLGVMSVETRRGAETSESLQALAAIFAAQLVGILQVSPDAHEQRKTGTS